ncbi:hypothetical protein GCM10009710_00780 [Aeromicrobium alkaliterrae]|uniref:Uncharacterized protein n=1 Tax=Aeromicrobium alkaliterrae TaxID=302168 RepID=A0ABN2JE86_9ACTN
MLTRTSVIADLAVLVTLLAVVLLFSDRSTADWVMAGAMFVGITVVGAVVRWRQAR